jgi:hypothetical protein
MSFIFVCCPLSKATVQLCTVLAIWISTDVWPQILENVFSKISISGITIDDTKNGNLPPSTPSSFLRLAKYKAVRTFKGIVVAAAFRWSWEFCLVSVHVPYRTGYGSQGLHFDNIEIISISLNTPEASVPE